MDFPNGFKIPSECFWVVLTHQMVLTPKIPFALFWDNLGFCFFDCQFLFRSSDVFYRSAKVWCKFLELLSTVWGFFGGLWAFIEVLDPVRRTTMRSENTLGKSSVLVTELSLESNKFQRNESQWFVIVLVRIWPNSEVSRLPILIFWSSTLSTERRPSVASLWETHKPRETSQTPEI